MEQRLQRVPLRGGANDNAAMSDDLSRIAWDALRTRITRVFPAQVRAAVEDLTDEQIWWRPNETSNSIGNLILHLSGSLDHYLNRGLGGFEFQRDRSAEFAERRNVPKAELLRRFGEMVERAEKTFEKLGPERLTDPSPEQKMYSIVFEDLLSVATHFANHAGQMVWIAKMLGEGSLDDVWIRTHKELGGWKRR